MPPADAAYFLSRPERAAAIGVVLTLTSNMAVKVPTAFLTGTSAYARQVSIGVGVLLVGLWLGAWVVVSSNPLMVP
jgi:VIT1/CCC1 family predicted Fe2+/Mn2+ transporter